MSESDAGIYVCHACVGDEFLKQEVRSEGDMASCSLCGKRRKSFTLEELADRIHSVLEAHFYLTPNEPSGIDYALVKEGVWDWERPGEPVDTVISEIADIDLGLAGKIREQLSDLHGYGAVRDGDEDPYANDAHYEELPIDDLNYQETWNEFRKEIKARARFFSQYAQRALDEIFGDIGSLSSYDGTPVIRVILPTDDNRFIHRARVCFSETELKDMLAAPVKQIGPPPFRKARAGRMNAAGISVFYGAMDRETCIAEARAPVGSYVVLGRFEFIRPVRLLDFDVLTRVYVSGSHFDPDYNTRRSRVAFLKRLVREISRPVMPRDEEFEYLPTQAVSEYLAARFDPRLDGIIFHSSQTDGEGRNLVLFNHACVIEPYELPEGSEIEFNMGWGSEDNYDDSITIWETVPGEESGKEDPNKEKPKEDHDPFGFGDFIVTEPPDIETGSDDEVSPSGEPTLRLDVNNIDLQVIRSVKYETSSRMVSRHRKTNNDDDSPF